MVRSILPRYGGGHARLLPRLERLHRDLTRTRDEEEEEREDAEDGSDEQRSKGWSAWGHVVGRGLGGPWATATLLAATSVSPALALPAAVLAAAGSLVAGLCFVEMEGVWKRGSPSSSLYRGMLGSGGEFPAFVCGWAWVCAMVCSQAALARGLAALVDAATGGHLRATGLALFGPESPLGFFLDFPAMAIAAVPSLLCACGLQDSPLLRLSLNVGVAMATVAITLTGLTSPAPAALPASQDGLVYSLLRGAALMSIGSSGVWSVGGEARKFRKPRSVLSVSVALGLTAAFLSTLAVTAALPLWTTPVHAEQVECPLSVLLSPAAVPAEWKGGAWFWLLRLGVVCLCVWSVGLALVESSLGAQSGVQALARDGLLHRKLLQLSTHTGTPVRATLAFGGLSSALALLLDLPTLLGLSASAALLMQILLCTVALQLRYQPDAPLRRAPAVVATSASPCRRREQRNQMVVCYLKDGFRDLPTTVSGQEEEQEKDKVQEKLRLREEAISLDLGSTSSGADRKASTSSWSSSAASTASTCPCTALLGTTEEPPLLAQKPVCSSRLPLLDESPSSGLDSDSDSLSEEEAALSSETDIDAVVAEYEEKVGVATLTGVGIGGGGGAGGVATAATARRVALALVALLACAAAQALALAPSGPAPTPHHAPSALALQLATALVSFLLLALILRQPQRKLPPRSRDESGLRVRVPLCPWMHAAALFLHAVLLLCGLRDSALYAAAWWGVGLIVYFSYGIHHSLAAKFPSRLQERQVKSSQSVEEDERHLTRVDTILIARCSADRHMMSFCRVLETSVKLLEKEMRRTSTLHVQMRGNHSSARVATEDC